MTTDHSRKRLTFYPMAERHNLVRRADFGAVPAETPSVQGLIDCIPSIHAGKAFRKAIDAIVTARQNGRPVLLGMGAHVIKCGLAPLLVRLMQESIITGIALNGAGSIHDFELAAFGETSEDVAKELARGRFGFVEETGAWMGAAIREGASRGLGLGQSLYAAMDTAPERFPFRHESLVWQAGHLGLPCTVHVAIGTDFIHLHPALDGASLGATSFRDFEIIADQVCELEGGVYWNLGSAVVLPEVFLKAVSKAHNLGRHLEGLTTIDMDMLLQYRATTNVVKRPSLGVGQGFHLTGHHEIMVPLVALTLLERLRPQ
ncbi:MAG TPA: hypothetical protein PLP29_16065 [Candidatus Ozemobacteraceae bacterium]|nr:hypothetical protein [Candidatus Ozemobacteraceae bacterium]